MIAAHVIGGINLGRIENARVIYMCAEVSKELCSVSSFSEDKCQQEKRYH